MKLEASELIYFGNISKKECSRITGTTLYFETIFSLHLSLSLSLKSANRRRLWQKTDRGERIKSFYSSDTSITKK